MWSVKRSWVWLRRWNRCRGFGIQSPTDYAFVRYVVNEHWPYYAYRTLRRKYPRLSGDERRLCELALRVANWRQPLTAVVCGDGLRARDIYIRCGCNRCNVVAAPEEASTIDLLWMSLDVADPKQVAEQTFCRSSRQTLIVVEGISRSPENRAFWEWLSADERTGVAMDLYWAGIVFLDTNRHKQIYTINF